MGTLIRVDTWARVLVGYAPTTLSAESPTLGRKQRIINVFIFCPAIVFGEVIVNDLAHLLTQGHNTFSTFSILERTIALGSVINLQRTTIPGIVFDIPAHGCADTDAGMP